MITFFSTGSAKHKQITNINDKKIKDFDKCVFNVLLNLAKRVVSDGEGASKFIQIDVLKCKNEDDAKKIAFSIANSPLVKTAITGEDANWGRVVMAIGKAGVQIKHEKLPVIIDFVTEINLFLFKSNCNILPTLLSFQTYNDRFDLSYAAV